MDKQELERDRREQQRVQRLGTSTPVCVGCGETDSRCHELHHIAGQRFGDEVSVICRNCHRKLSDDQLDHPAPIGNGTDRLELIGHFLLGLADLFWLIAGKLKEFGQALIGEASARQNTVGDSGATAGA